MGLGAEILIDGAPREKDPWATCRSDVLEYASNTVPENDCEGFF